MRIANFMLGILLNAALAWSASAPPDKTVVLGNDNCVRCFLVSRTPMVITSGGSVKVAMEPVVTKKGPQPIPDYQSALPPADWVKPDFDDSAWKLQRSPVEMTPEWARNDAALHSATANSIICLRWRFVVDEPARVQNLQFALEYVGGVAVYVNGQELSRAHLSAGELKPETMAEKYPDNLYCLPDGKFLQSRRRHMEIAKELMPEFERRYRKVEGLAIPGNLLRKGANVLALEVRRAPINEAAVAALRRPEGSMYTIPGLWSYAGLKRIALTSASGAGLAPSQGRPKGVQVWNVLPFETITSFGYREPAEPLRPVVIAATRNGVFSGRLAVSSDEAIRGLKVAASDLKLAGGDGMIPVSAVRVRYAEPAEPEKCLRTPRHRFNGLVEAIPAEIPVIEATIPKRDDDYLYLASQPISRSGVTSGAVASLWFTVRVPKDAKAGAYEGVITVTANGLKATAVPLRVTVHDWAMPDPKDFRQRHLQMMSAESVALHYNVPFWSDRHFELMGKSLALMAEVNARQVILNLAIDFYDIGSNRESLVRWIRQADGSYTYDFTPFDKYLDMAARVIGKPMPLRLNCWGEFERKGSGVVYSGTNWNVKTVSLLNPATGKLEPLEQPVFGTEESFAFWKPVLDEVRRKIEVRGWFDVTCMGHNSYCYEPLPRTVSVYKRIWPDGVWAITSHNNGRGGAFKATEAGVKMPLNYGECVWTEGTLTPRGYRALLAPSKTIWCSVQRGWHRDDSPLTHLRDLPEDMIMRGHDGIGQLGVDNFPVRAANGRLYCLPCNRGGLGPSCSTLSILAPGPDGPVATERFEMFREGVELCEAILFLERTLQEKRIGGELAAKVDRYLEERGSLFVKHWTDGRLWDGRSERDAALMALCAEIAATK